MRAHLAWVAVAVALAACGGAAEGSLPVERVLAPAILDEPGGGRVANGVCLALDPFDGAPLAALADQALAAAGLVRAAPCDWAITVDAAPTATRAVAARLGLADAAEAYAVETRAGTTRLVAASPRGALYALRAALALTTPDGGGRRVPDATLVDGPAFAARGVLEGFYGAPYTIDERRGVFERMAALRQNRYVYAPQDDPWAHGKWATPYPPSAAAALVAAAADADRLLIDLVWAVRPAVNAFGGTRPSDSIMFSSPAHFATLTAKLDAVRALGVRRFALFLDDTDPGLFWDQDNAAFAAPVEAHASLANRLQSWLAARDPGARLLFVGDHYSDASDGWEDYATRLGALLDPRVEVLWTGPGTFSPTIAARDLAPVDACLARPVTVWDNWPIEVEPLAGRTTDLPAGAGGFLSNAVLNEYRAHTVDDFYATMGPLGLYQWSPARYQAARAMTWWTARGSR